jgi:hypothetical protein
MRILAMAIGQAFFLSQCGILYRNLLFPNTARYSLTQYVISKHLLKRNFALDSRLPNVVIFFSRLNPGAAPRVCTKANILHNP